MAIHQIQIRHAPVEDRLLLRLSTTDNCEYRLWLTRRFTARLWIVLVKMLEHDPAVRQQFDTEMRKTVLEMQHEGYSRDADYSKQFDETAPRRLLLGDAPLLLAKAVGKSDPAGTHVLSLHPEHGSGIDITLDTKLLHTVARLLHTTVAQTDWNLDLHLAGPQAQAADAPAVPRRLN